MSCSKFAGRALFAALFAVLILPAPAQVPEWIWHDNQGAATQRNEVRFFRKTFAVAPGTSQAILYATADDAMEIFVNGQRVLSTKSWRRAERADVSHVLQPGENVLAARCQNEAGAAAFIAKLELTTFTPAAGGDPAQNPGQRRITFVVTDKTWVSAAQAPSGWQQLKFDAATWTRAVSLGKIGVAPWGDVMAPPAATAAASLKAPPGFKVELLRSAQLDEGSWVCMTVDDRGRFIISPQAMTSPRAGGLLRITPAREGAPLAVERIGLPVGAAQGLLYAHNRLYVSGRGPSGSGLYRLRDTTGDDRYDRVDFLKAFHGGGEHGPHAIVLGPDNLLYLMNGNHTKVPEGISPDSPHRNYAEDLLLPRQWDANGHAVGVLAPGGYVVRTDAEGTKWELLLAGFRNAYDFDFNADGELFTFDSDMEWDIGAPWYRPTRINHGVSGGEYGWRSGTGKWPNHYPDNLPTTLDIGKGSPTGVKFGTASRFPEKYRRALFACDWAYGIIYAVHLTPHGATYRGEAEEFVSGKPLNVADVEFGADGAMYFVTGGRGTQSGLYRVSFEGPLPAPGLRARAELEFEKQAAAARTLRRQLEAFHGKSDPAAIDFVWPHLNSEDRWIRYAARLALEWQDLHRWRERALNEPQPRAALTAWLALARSGGKELQEPLLKALARFPLDSLSEELALEKLRVIQVSFIRQGRPTPELAALAMEKLDRHYPARSEALNRELCQLLVYLEAPATAGKTVALLAAAPTQEEQMHYAFHLRTLQRGWTMPDRRAYFSWFNQAADYKGGNSFAKFLGNIKADAASLLAPEQRLELAPLLGETAAAPPPPATNRPFVREWSMAELVPLLDQVGARRNFQKGRQAFIDAQCLACHRFGNEGGAVGPDITAAASRFSRRDLLEAILEPSKVLSDQYQNLIVYTKDGEDVTGRLVDEDAEHVVLVTNPLTQDRTRVPKKEIVRRETSQLSPMPEGLVNVLTRDELLDLLAYIEASGKKNHAAFK